MPKLRSRVRFSPENEGRDEKQPDAMIARVE